MHSKPLLLASVKRVETFEKILRAGLRGVHHLFSNQMIRDAFEKTQDGLHLAESGMAEKLKTALAGLLACDDVSSASEYVAGLEPGVRNALIIMYFDFLDQYRLALRRKESVH
ncbi:MAG: hypothetical protein HXY20_10000 [Acidobacteria bacterium]|jgi:hypothetical protein|nr:hypothetical protein [Acidobacteriota bacterium]